MFKLKQFWVAQMPNPFLGVRIPTDLNEALLARSAQTGQSKSEIVIAALKTYLGLATHQERLDAIEQRLSALEAANKNAQPSKLETTSNHHRQDQKHRQKANGT